MRRTARDRPIPDYLRDFRRDVDVQLFPEANGGEELGVDLRRQLVAHLTRAKSVDAEILRDTCTGHWTAVVGTTVRAGSTVGSSRTPSNLAATPDSNAPSSFEDPMKMALTDETRPRRCSGVNT